MCFIGMCESLGAPDSSHSNTSKFRSAVAALSWGSVLEMLLWLVFWACQAWKYCRGYSLAHNDTCTCLEHTCKTYIFKHDTSFCMCFIGMCDLRMPHTRATATLNLELLLWLVFGAHRNCTCLYNTRKINGHVKICEY